MNVEKQNQGNHNRQSHQRFAWFESTLRVKRIDFRLYQNDLYRNDFVSKQPDTVCIIVSQRNSKVKPSKLSNARENAGDHVTIGFHFACDWFREWHESLFLDQSKTKTKKQNQSKAKQEDLKLQASTEFGTVPSRQ